MLEWVDQIDFNELYILLLDASRKAFRDVQAAHPDETFYAFGLHYDNEENIILPSCNSEEAHLRRWDLTETDRARQTLEWFYSRWAWDDWRYYRWGRQYFTSVSTWMRHNVYGRLGGSEDTEIIAVATVLEDAIMRVCLNVLKTLDNEKLFGQGEARERVVLNVVSNEETIGTISQTYLLNSTSSYERWCVEMELFEHAYEFFRL